jgi:hypothetical protein
MSCTSGSVTGGWISLWDGKWFRVKNTSTRFCCIVKKTIGCQSRDVTNGWFLLTVILVLFFSGFPFKRLRKKEYGYFRRRQRWPPRFAFLRSIHCNGSFYLCMTSGRVMKFNLPWTFTDTESSYSNVWIIELFRHKTGRLSRLTVEFCFSICYFVSLTTNVADWFAADYFLWCDS